MLSILCAMEHEIDGQQVDGMLSIPQPRSSLARLFSALVITPPSTLPHRNPPVFSDHEILLDGHPDSDVLGPSPVGFAA